MALINCPECNRVVSDKANSCPNCGYPLLSQQVTLSSTAQLLDQKTTFMNSILEICDHAVDYRESGIPLELMTGLLWEKLDMSYDNKKAFAAVVELAYNTGLSKELTRILIRHHLEKMIEQ